MSDAYPLLTERRDEILSVIAREERQFSRTLEAGIGLLEEALIPLTSAERASTLGPQERERRAAELAARRAEIERLGTARGAA